MMTRPAGIAVSALTESHVASTNTEKTLDLAGRLSVLAVLCAALSVAAPAQTYQTFLVGNPVSGVPTQGTDGNFYATSPYGLPTGPGSVIRVEPGGNVTTLYTFCSKVNCEDGEEPFSGVIQATDGNLYGTTFNGGTSVQSAGTVFKITPGGELSTLYSFCSQPNCSDGEFPYAGMVQGLNGKLYGVTSSTIYEITSAGTLKTLRAFCSETNCTDGGAPPQAAPMMLGTDGNFYGTTTTGGANGSGTVYRMTPNGKYTVLYNFGACSQSSCPDGGGSSGLVQAANGNFYGVTVSGGANNSFYCSLGKSGSFGCGTVYELTSAGQFRVIHNFCSVTNCTDGAYALAGLTSATDGNLYGTTALGGANLCGYNPQLGCGSIFRLTLQGEFTTIYSFCGNTGCYGGGGIYALTQATYGDLIGNGGDVIFSLSVGLGPFVETRPTAGKVGSTVSILGNNLKSATEVTFGGTAAAFTIVSDTEVKATVPAEATSGTVVVTAGTGSLKSNVPFQVH